MSSYCECSSNFSVKTTTTKPAKVVNYRAARTTSTYSNKNCHATNCYTAKSKTLYQTPINTQFKINNNNAFQIPAVASTNKFTVCAPQAYSTVAAKAASASKVTAIIAPNVAKPIISVATQQKSVTVTQTVIAAVSTTATTTITNKQVSISNIISKTSAASASNVNINITTAANSKPSSPVKIITPTPAATIEQKTAAVIKGKSTVPVSSVPTTKPILEPTIISTTPSRLNIKKTVKTVEIADKKAAIITPNVAKPVIPVTTQQKSAVVTQTVIAAVSTAATTTTTITNKQVSISNVTSETSAVSASNVNINITTGANSKPPSPVQIITPTPTPAATLEQKTAAAIEEKSTVRVSIAPATKPILEPIITSTTPSILNVKKTAETAEIVDKKAAIIAPNIAKPVIPVVTQQKSAVVTQTVISAVSTAATTTTTITNKQVSISNVTSETSAASTSNVNINITSAANSKPSSPVKIINPAPTAAATIEQKTAAVIEEKSTVSVSSAPTTKPILEPTIASTTPSILNVKKMAETAEIVGKKAAIIAPNIAKPVIPVVTQQKSAVVTQTVIAAVSTAAATTTTITNKQDPISNVTSKTSAASASNVNTNITTAGNTKPSSPVKIITPTPTPATINEQKTAAAIEETSTVPVSSAPTTKPILEPTVTSITPSKLNIKKTVKTVEIADKKSPKINISGDQETPKSLTVIKTTETPLAAESSAGIAAPDDAGTPKTPICNDSSTVPMTAKLDASKSAEEFRRNEVVNKTIIGSVITTVKSTIVNKIFGYASNTKFDVPFDPAVVIEEKSKLPASPAPVIDPILEPPVTSTTPSILNVKKTAEIADKKSPKISVPGDQETPQSLTVIKTTKTPLVAESSAGIATPDDAGTPKTPICNDSSTVPATAKLDASKSAEEFRRKEVANKTIIGSVITTVKLTIVNKIFGYASNTKFDVPFDPALVIEEKSKLPASPAPVIQPVLEPTVRTTTPSTLNVKKTASTAQISDKKSPKINVPRDQKTPKAPAMITTSKTPLAAIRSAGKTTPAHPRTPRAPISNGCSTVAANSANRLATKFDSLKSTEEFKWDQCIIVTIISSVIITLVKWLFINKIFGYTGDTKFDKEKSTVQASSDPTTKLVLESTVTSTTQSTLNVKKTAASVQIANNKSQKINSQGDRKTPKAHFSLSDFNLATKASLAALRSAWRTTPKTPRTQITNGSSPAAINLASRLAAQFRTLEFTEQFNLTEYVNETIICLVITMFKSTVITKIVGSADDTKFDDPFDMDSSYEYWRI